MKTLFKLLVLLLVLDAIWLGLFLGPPFLKMIEKIQKLPVVVNPFGMIFAYTSLFALAAIFLPKTNSDFEAFLLGSLTYAIYDGTNFALFKDYDPLLAIADVAWGGTLFYLLKKIIY